MTGKGFEGKWRSRGEGGKHESHPVDFIMALDLKEEGSTMELNTCECIRCGRDTPKQFNSHIFKGSKFENKGEDMGWIFKGTDNILYFDIKVSVESLIIKTANYLVGEYISFNHVNYTIKDYLKAVKDKGLLCISKGKFSKHNFRMGESYIDEFKVNFSLVCSESGQRMTDRLRNKINLKMDEAVMRNIKKTLMMSNTTIKIRDNLELKISEFFLSSELLNFMEYIYKLDFRGIDDHSVLWNKGTPRKSSRRMC